MHAFQHCYGGLWRVIKATDTANYCNSLEKYYWLYVCDFCIVKVFQKIFALNANLCSNELQNQIRSSTQEEPGALIQHFYHRLILYCVHMTVTTQTAL